MKKNVHVLLVVLPEAPTPELLKLIADNRPQHIVSFGAVIEQTNPGVYQAAIDPESCRLFIHNQVDLSGLIRSHANCGLLRMEAILSLVKRFFATAPPHLGGL